MQYLLTVVLLFTQVFTSFAQSPGDATPPRSEKTKAIRLDAKRYRADGETLIRLSGIKVVAMCADTNYLGFVQVGMINRMIRAVPDKPYTPYLQDFVNEVFNDVYTEPGFQLLWIIKDLRINESSEEALVRLRADAYLSTDKEHYRLLTAFDTILVRGGVEITSLHDDNISEAIQLFYLSCEEAAGKYTGDTVLTEERIVARQQEPFRAPIYTDTAYTEGVYLDYKEFLANAPSFRDFDIVVKKKKTRVYVNGADSSRKELFAFWGVSKRGKLYKYHAKKLMPIERQGNQFVLSKYMDDVNKKNRSGFWGGMTLGLVVGGLAIAAGDPAMVTDWSDVAGHSAEAAVVDVESGELVF